MLTFLTPDSEADLSLEQPNGMDNNSLENLEAIETANVLMFAVVSHHTHACSLIISDEKSFMYMVCTEYILRTLSMRYDQSVVTHRMSFFRPERQD